jgi:hypothetical protein
MESEKDLQWCGVIEVGPRQSVLEVPNKAEMAEWALRGKSALTFDL